MILSYANIHALNLAYENHEFRDILNQSDVVFCDGFGVILGAQILGHRLAERFTPPDWLDKLADLAARNNFSMYLIGSLPGVAEKAARQIQLRYPTIRITGTYHGYFNKESHHPDNHAVVASINAAQPDILIVGFGMPMQERWIAENWEHLQVSIALPVGAALDYVAGTVRRGPRWMTDHGLEWLARLIIEPRRLWRRYIVGNPVFLLRVLAQRFGLRRF
jgi:N-acetylglucosaminyldiphosphoundecaprenol N-acetyl-beta-D-mannosaminyltransferase